MLLKKRGYESVVAHNGKEAVEIVKEAFDDFDLIFMDNMMPVMVSGSSRAIDESYYLIFVRVCLPSFLLCTKPSISMQSHNANNY